MAAVVVGGGGEKPFRVPVGQLIIGCQCESLLRPVPGSGRSLPWPRWTMAGVCSGALDWDLQVDMVAPAGWDLVKCVWQLAVQLAILLPPCLTFLWALLSCLVLPFVCLSASHHKWMRFFLVCLFLVLFGQSLKVCVLVVRVCPFSKGHTFSWPSLKEKGGGFGNFVLFLCAGLLFCFLELAGALAVVNWWLLYLPFYCPY